MSDKVIVSKQDANDLPYVEQEHSGDKYVLLEDIKHWLEDATPVSGKPSCYVSKHTFDLAMSNASGIGIKGISIEKLLHDDVALYTTPQPADTVQSIHKLIQDDSYAISFQSLEQYRKALITAIKGE